MLYPCDETVDAAVPYQASATSMTTPTLLYVANEVTTFTYFEYLLAEQIVDISFVWCRVSLGLSEYRI